MNSKIKIVFTTIGVIFLIIAILLLIPKFLNLFGEDISPLDDSDLHLKVVSVPDNENAYVDLIKLESVMYYPEEKSEQIYEMANGDMWDNQLAEELISRNTQAFSYFAAAARKASFQDPALADPAKITLKTVSASPLGWFRMARLSVIRAMSLAKQGKTKEALDEAFNFLEIGQQIQASQASAIVNTSATALKQIGLETIQKILTTAKLSSDDLKQYARNLHRFSYNKDGLIASFKGEYQRNSSYIDLLATNKDGLLASTSEKPGIIGTIIAEVIKGDYYFQPNKTKLLFAESTRALISNIDVPCSENNIPDQKLSRFDLIKLYVQENAIGEWFYKTSPKSYLTHQCIDKYEESLFISATQVQLAMKAYKNDHQTYPVALKDLVPNYLASVPLDPFDGKPLKYDSEKKIIYSVGQDMQDSSGSKGDDWRKMPDPTFKTDF